MMKHLGKRLSALLFLCGLTSLPLYAGWGDLMNSARQALDQSGVVNGGSGAVSSLSTDEIVQGLKEALNLGVEKAIGLLGRSGGYLDDPQVRIPLPDTIDTIAKGLRAAGQGELVDQFTGSMNRAAEQAVPKTVEIFSQSIRDMSLQDARGILQSSDSAATDYFRKHSSDQLRAAILPIVKRTTAQNEVTARYKDLAGQAGFLGSLLNKDTLDLDRYVTDRALDGLFLKLAEQERLIRKDPLARSSDLLKTVFGSVER